MSLKKRYRPHTFITELAVGDVVIQQNTDGSLRRELVVVEDCGKNNCGNLAYRVYNRKTKTLMFQKYTISELNEYLYQRSGRLDADELTKILKKIGARG